MKVRGFPRETIRNNPGEQLSVVYFCERDELRTLCISYIRSPILLQKIKVNISRPDTLSLPTGYNEVNERIDIPFVARLH